MLDLHSALTRNCSCNDSADAKFFEENLTDER